MSRRREAGYAATSRRAAELATELLLPAIGADGPGETRREVIAPQLVVRASTGG
jgi:DNA-binding LacI/PurR family transcriptional regulator